MARAISGLKIGEIVWESCQYGNMRYEVVGEPHNCKPENIPEFFREKPRPNVN